MALPLVLAVLLLVWFPERRRYWQALLGQIRTPIGAMVLVTLALWLPSVAVSPLPLRSFEAWARIPVFIGLIGFFWAMLSDERRALALALKALLVAGAVTAVFAVFSLTVLPTEFVSFIRLKGWQTGTVRPLEIFKEYASMAILLIPVLVWAGRRLGGRWPALSVATVVGLLAVVWLTNNRSAMAGLLMVLVVGAGLMMSVRRDLAVNVVISAVVIAVMAALVLWLYETRGHIQPPENTVAIVPPWLLDWQRQTIWARTIEMGMNSPWVGNGINVINLLPGAEDPLPTSRLHIIPAHPHNWLVEVFAETGAIGAFALLTLVITMFLKLAGDFLKSGNTALLAALLVNVGYWASGLLNVSFWSAWWQISYLLLTAFCLAGRERPPGESI
jgi:O-antigen ligase